MRQGRSQEWAWEGLPPPPPQSRLAGREDMASAFSRKIAALNPVYGRFATPFSKEFNLTIAYYSLLTIVALATATAALRAAWEKIC